MLYLIGLGLSYDGISERGLRIARRCKKIYLESYTVDFPYSLKKLEEVLQKKITPLSREEVEGLSLIGEASKKDVALLIYGSPLTATTHITLLNEAKNSKVKYEVIYAGSVIDAVGESGLQIYKFGKIASMPAWTENYTPDSFAKIVHQNLSQEAHSLILIDIGLDFQTALQQLKIAFESHKIKLKKFLVCQALGTKNSHIHYKTFEEFLDFEKVRKPYCIIIPGKLHFAEKEFLDNL